MIRQILTFHLATILLFSNVGIPLFKHICHTQGKTWSSLVVPAKSCCSKKKVNGVKPCHSAKSETGLTSRPCCENQQNILQLSVDYLQSNMSLAKASPPLDLHDAFVFSINYDLDFHSNHNSFHRPHGPPGNLYGRSLLISQQTFRC